MSSRSGGGPVRSPRWKAARCSAALTTVMAASALGTGTVLATPASSATVGFSAIGGQLLSSDASTFSSGVVGIAFASGQSGWEVTASGVVSAFGGAPQYPYPRQLNQPIVGIAAMPNGSGYWLVAADGGIFSYGDARFYGSMGGLHLNQPIVGMAATPSGKGYWLVAADGGIFTFGNAKFYGSTGSMHLNQPIVGMASSKNGGGYWLVAADGGIFTFGDATFDGSTGSLHLNRPIVGMAALPNGSGYWLVASDGGIFTFGDAHFFGSDGGDALDTSIVGMASTSNGGGYWLVSAGGQTSPFGDADAVTSPIPVGPAASGGNPDPFNASWDVPLPSSTTETSSSSEIVSNFVSQYESTYGSVGVGNGAYGIGVYTVSASQPYVPVHVRAGCNNFTPDTGTTVPIPANTVPPAGNDSSVAIWQPSTNTEWELWQLQNIGGTWTACWGGRLQDVAASSGVFPSPYGDSASGISYLGTTVTEADVAAGAIDHVINLSVIDCNGAVAPADRTDCGSDPGAPAEGTWFRLPATVAMPAGLTPFAQMVFKALQAYGAVVTDQSGAVMVGTEQSSDWAVQGNSGVDPITASFAGQPEYSALDGIPWSDLEVIDPPY